MKKVKSIFIFSVKEVETARKLRETAHQGFKDTPGLIEWQRLETVSDAKGHLFCDLFIWESDDLANPGNDVFSVHQDTVPYLAQVDKIVFSRAFQ